MSLFYEGRLDRSFTKVVMIINADFIFWHLIC